VLSTTIDKYVYVTSIRSSTSGVRVAYSKNEEVTSIDQIEHPLVRATLGHLKILGGVCQSASKTDPTSASKVDPFLCVNARRPQGDRARSGALATRSVARGGSCGRPVGGRSGAVLKRQLSLPVSTISQWWVSRSSSAVVILASRRQWATRRKARFVVTRMEVCS